MPSGVRNLTISWAGAQLPNIWPRSQAVKTSASHAEDPGSIPGGVTKERPARLIPSRQRFRLATFRLVTFSSGAKTIIKQTR